ncbi:hypothetical protein MGN70_009742 [Eutypa lata]|nr:hypothetical protein MGN70_009742 [Eutypa lata]
MSVSQDHDFHNNWWIQLGFESWGPKPPRRPEFARMVLRHVFPEGIFFDNSGGERDETERLPFPDVLAKLSAAFEKAWTDTPIFITSGLKVSIWDKKGFEYIKLLLSTAGVLMYVGSGRTPERYFKHVEELLVLFQDSLKTNEVQEMLWKARETESPVGISKLDGVIYTLVATDLDDGRPDGIFQDYQGWAPKLGGMEL